MLCGKANPEQRNAGLELGTAWSLSEDFCVGNLAVMSEFLQAGLGFAVSSIQREGLEGVNGKGG